MKKKIIIILRANLSIWWLKEGWRSQREKEKGDGCQCQYFIMQPFDKIHGITNICSNFWTKALSIAWKTILSESNTDAKCFSGAHPPKRYLQYSLLKFSVFSWVFIHMNLIWIFNYFCIISKSILWKHAHHTSYCCMHSMPVIAVPPPVVCSPHNRAHLALCACLC